MLSVCLPAIFLSIFRIVCSGTASFSFAGQIQRLIDNGVKFPLPLETARAIGLLDKVLTFYKQKHYKSASLTRVYRLKSKETVV
jgi:hypothetical protein